MRVLLSILLLLAQTLYAQHTALPNSAKSDSALGFSIIKGKKDTVEAIFKWVADNISYDVARRDALNKKKKTAAQTIGTTLRTRKGVCDDYTNLINAFYKKAGYEVEKITGYTIDIY